MFQRLPTDLAQVKAGNTCKNLLNEIRQLIYYFYRAREITKKAFNNIMNSVKVEIIVPLKKLSNVWRKLEMPWINCEISLQLKWSKYCILAAGTAANQNPEFKITDTKTYAPVVTLSTQDNIKLLKQLESGFKRTINWNKYLSKITNQAQNRYLGFLINARFQGINRLFVLSFKDENCQESNRQYYIPTVEIKKYNFMIDG